MVWFHHNLCGQFVYMDKCRELCICQARAPSWWKGAQVWKCFSCMSAALNEYSQGGQISCPYMSHLNISICLGATKHIPHPTKSLGDCFPDTMTKAPGVSGWMCWWALRQPSAHGAHSSLGEPCPMSGQLQEGWNENVAVMAVERNSWFPHLVLLAHLLLCSSPISRHKSGLRTVGWN